MLSSRKEESQEPLNGTDQENLLHDRHASTARSEQQQELHQGPSSEIWTCRFRVVRMQPNEYVKAKWHAQVSTRVQEYQ